MQTHNFGGFAFGLPGIDIRFEKAGQADHFHLAWEHHGGPPPLNDEGPLSLEEQVAIGTTLEHELRHFHDYLICHDLLRASWLKRQTFATVLPVIVDALKDTTCDTIPIPILDWAKLSQTRRDTLFQSYVPWMPENARAWSPLMVRKNPRRIPPTVVPDNVTPGGMKQFYRRAMEDAAVTLESMQVLRDGLDRPPRGELRYTPRFAFEFSALIAQAVAALITYGHREFWRFLATVAADSAPYNRFFGEVMMRFLTRGGVVEANPENIDVAALGAIGFWCMTGTAADGSRSGPATRLFSLLDAADADWNEVFPSGVGATDLLDLWDTRMSVVPWRQSLTQTQTEFEEEIDRTLVWIEANAGDDLMGGLTRDTVVVFRAVLYRRRLLINAILQQPLDYIDPSRWMRDLSRWPQCPVHLKYSPGRSGRRKADFARFGKGALFNLATSFSYEDGSVVEDDDIGDRVGDVHLPAFFPGGLELPLETINRLQIFALMVDVLMDPAQVPAKDENKIRSFVKSDFGKHLLRLL